MIFIGM
jgi:hypothetical protein